MKFALKSLSYDYAVECEGPEGTNGRCICNYDSEKWARTINSPDVAEPFPDPIMIAVGNYDVLVESAEFDPIMKKILDELEYGGERP